MYGTSKCRRIELRLTAPTKCERIELSLTVPPSDPSTEDDTNPQTLYCPFCGKWGVDSEDNYCNQCGEQLTGIFEQ